MIAEVDIDRIRQTISFLRKVAEIERIMLPTDPYGRMVPAIDSPLMRKILEAEELDRYWTSVVSDRRKNGPRSEA